MNKCLDRHVKTTTATITKYFDDRKPSKKNGQHSVQPEGQKKLKNRRQSTPEYLEKQGLQVTALTVFMLFKKKRLDSLPFKII